VAQEHPFDAGYFTREARLEAYSFGVGRFKSSSVGDGQAERELAARRAYARTYTCEASFAMPPGYRFTLSGHPNADLNKQLLVVRSRVLVDDGTGPAGAGSKKQSTHVLTCIDAQRSFFAPVKEKRRITGNQTAFVVGATPEGTVDVDDQGRVLLLFRWDRRDASADPPKRRVRVSQAWAGNGFGFVTLPRIGDEVVVSYDDGDPEQPLVVGRVHDKTVPMPLNLPAERTQAVWRSRSFNDGGPGDGYNRILMDDQTGAERLELHAQRDFKSETGHDSVTTVGNNASSTVAGNSTNKVSGSYSLSAGSTSISTGPYSLSASTITESARTDMTLTAGDKRTDESANHFLKSGSFYVTLDDVFQINAAHLHAFCGSSIKLVCPGKIELICGGSSIVLTPGGIAITSSGIVTINGGLVKLNCD
jgi:type VI secretion system secreted protein VgrG